MSTPVTNTEFARRVGCHFTMASKLRNGERMPSGQLLAKIIREFGLVNGDRDHLLRAMEDRNAPAMADVLRRCVFRAVEPTSV